MTVRRIIKHGNSLTLGIPAHYCRELGIERGDHVAVALGENGILLVRKVDDEMYRQIVSKEIDYEK